MDGDLAAGAALRPPAGPAHRLPRPGADRSAHEPGQQRPAAGADVRRDDPADHVERGAGRRGGGHPAACSTRCSRSARSCRFPSSTSWPSGSRAASIPAVMAVQAGVGGAGHRRRGVGLGRAGREGLRRRAGADRPASASEAEDVRSASLRAAGVRRRYLPAMDLAPSIGLILVLGRRRPHGGRRHADHRRAGGLQRVRGHVGVAVAHHRHDRVLRPAGRRRARAGPRGAVHRADRRRPAPCRGAARPRAAGDRTGRRPLRPRPLRLRPCPPGARRLRPVRSSRARPIALVGATGSGKSTVARLLARFYDVDDGAIELDGIDLRRLRLHDLRRSVGIVFEDTFLFHDTVAANIAFADPDASAGSHRAGGGAGRSDRVHRRAAGGLRHAAGRARVLALRWSAAAHRHRPGHPRRPAGAGARRRHLGRRPLEGARDPGRPRHRDGRPDDDRHRPPAGHHLPGRPGRPARRRHGWPRRAPTRSCSPSNARYGEVLAAWAVGTPSSSSHERRASELVAEVA